MRPPSVIVVHGRYKPFNISTVLIVTKIDFEYSLPEFRFGR